MVLHKHWKPLARAIAGLGLALPIGAPAQDQSHDRAHDRTGGGGISAAEAPAQWVAYAQGATATIEALLDTDSETALRLKSALGEMQMDQPVVLKVWVDQKGAVERIVCEALPSEQVQVDLRTLTLGQRLPGKMPKGMMLPMRIAVQLEAAQPTSVSNAPHER